MTRMAQTKRPSSLESLWRELFSVRHEFPDTSFGNKLRGIAMIGLCFHSKTYNFHIRFVYTSHKRRRHVDTDLLDLSFDLGYLP